MQALLVGKSAEEVGEIVGLFGQLVRGIGYRLGLLNVVREK